MPDHHAPKPVAHSWALALDDHPALADVRQWVRQRLDGVVARDTLADVLLVVDELVANAELHTHSPRGLVVARGHDGVQIEVTDADPTLPVLKPPSQTRRGGRGIYLVDALSTTWGVRPCDEGKTVWSHIDPCRPER
jgi:anti-sigma regulatory factor (Ser/Thr protein kinase)